MAGTSGLQTIKLPRELSSSLKELWGPLTLSKNHAVSRGGRSEPELSGGLSPER